MIDGKKITAVLPAYNAEKTLRKTVADIPLEIIDEIILVDDASQDGTVALARALGLFVVVHPVNRGYGGNQKTCYATALARGADIVVMVHPDHQYDPHLIPGLIRPIADGQYDAVFGSRMLVAGDARRGGMPLWKYISNKALSAFENAILQLRLSEYHSGFRAYGRHALQNIRLDENSDNFVFDTEIVVQLKLHKLRIREIPIPTRYFAEASSIGILPSINYGLNILRVMGQYILFRFGIKGYAKFI